MREDISEPKHWRATSPTSKSWSVRRRVETIQLPAEAVDAVFEADQAVTISQPAEPVTYPELVSRIHEQLAALEAQRVQLQLLLDKA